METIRNGLCIELRSSLPTRVSWLLHEYHHFLENTTQFKEKLGLLTTRYGKVQIAEWFNQINAGDFNPLVTDLLVKHYDPAYQSSIVRNFPKYRADFFTELLDDGDIAFKNAAKDILSQFSKVRASN